MFTPVAGGLVVVPIIVAVAARRRHRNGRQD